MHRIDRSEINIETRCFRNQGSFLRSRLYGRSCNCRSTSRLGELQGKLLVRLLIQPQNARDDRLVVFNRKSECLCIFFNILRKLSDDEWPSFFIAAKMQTLSKKIRLRLERLQSLPKTTSILIDRGFHQLSDSASVATRLLPDIVGEDLDLTVKVSVRGLDIGFRYFAAEYACDETHGGRIHYS